ncbi:Golgi membrane protein 1 isoform X1 [Conger conger]|uniref:Golgi membrane protein 1 isoform X1 n=1 Tax=Conger conger TaxID=82655 RepID=UPI002A5AC81B|nr:Golgi membrane protein 1 isoform X1 [Conger conger]
MLSCSSSEFFAHLPDFRLTVAMGGLGNPRRGGRSPPLLIGALIACVLVLGFNYWVSSSRNLELQTRLFEMEGAVRRAAAERLTLEEEKKVFEDKLRIQKGQIPLMEGRHKIQTDTMLDNWKQEKTTLMLNISSSTITIQTLKAHLAILEEIQKQLQDCQSNGVSLSDAMTACKGQLNDLKNECTAKSPPDSPTSQGSSSPSLSRTGQPEKPGLDDTKEPPVSTLRITRKDADPDPLKAKPSALETNEIPKAGEGDAPSPLTGRDVSKPQHSMALLPKSDVPQQELQAAVARPGEELEVIETRSVKLQVTGNGVVQVEKAEKPGEEHGHKPEDNPADNPEDNPRDKPGDQQNTSDSETVKQAQLKTNAGKDQAQGRGPLDLKKAIADYNGDDENEGELEADKQAELAKH